MISDPFAAMARLTDTILFFNRKLNEFQALKDAVSSQTITQDEFLRRYNEMQKNLTSVEQAWDKAVAERKKKDATV